MGYSTRRLPAAHFGNKWTCGRVRRTRWLGAQLCRGHSWFLSTRIEEGDNSSLWNSPRNSQNYCNKRMGGAPIWNGQLVRTHWDSGAGAGAGGKHGEIEATAPTHQALLTRPGSRIPSQIWNQTERTLLDRDKRSPLPSLQNFHWDLWSKFQIP